MQTVTVGPTYLINMAYILSTLFPMPKWAPGDNIVLVVRLESISESNAAISAARLETKSYV